MRLAFRLAAASAGFVAALAAAEIALRALGLGFGNSPVESDPYLHHVHPRSYSFVQRHPSGELGGFEVTYDADGRVVNQAAAASRKASWPASRCRVAFMGDSFAEAGQVPANRSYAALLEQAAREHCAVRNYGVRSYSPALYLVQWEREVSSWHPTHVFLLTFGNDVADDERYLRVARLGADGFPTAVPGPGRGWLTSNLRRLYVARLVRTVALQGQWAWEHRGEDVVAIGGVVEENPAWTAPTTSLLLELHARVTRAGARFVLSAVPSRYKLMGDGPVSVERDFHRRVADWSATVGVPFLPLDEAFERAGQAGVQLFFRHDIHFNEEGHALVAAVIGRAYPNLFTRWADITSVAVRAVHESSR